MTSLISLSYNEIDLQLTTGDKILGVYSRGTKVGDVPVILNTARYRKVHKVPQGRYKVPQGWHKVPQGMYVGEELSLLITSTWRLVEKQKIRRLVFASLFLMIEIS